MFFYADALELCPSDTSLNPEKKKNKTCLARTSWIMMKGLRFRVMISRHEYGSHPEETYNPTQAEASNFVQAVSSAPASPGERP